MKLKFDSSQEYQLQAVSSFVDLFDGQKLHKGDYSIEINDNITEGMGSLFQSELGIGNNLVRVFLTSAAVKIEKRVIP